MLQDGQSTNGDPVFFSFVFSKKCYTKQVYFEIYTYDWFCVVMHAEYIFAHHAKQTLVMHCITTMSLTPW